MIKKEIPYIFAYFCLVFITGLICYYRAFSGPFLFDDIGYIRDNLAIRDLSNLRAFWNTLDKPLRFITLLSFGINYHFHQLDVFGYHFVNFLIHVFNAIQAGFIVGLLYRLNDKQKSELSIYAPIFVTFLFLIHPIQSQAVSYMTQRFASLATFFYLGSFACYVCARISTSIKRIVLYFFFSIIFALASMFSKQISMTLPVMMIAFEWIFMSPENKREANQRRVVCLLAASFLVLIPLFYSFRVLDILSASGFSDSHQGDYLTGFTYLLTQSRVILTYLRLLVLPYHQTFDYDFTVSPSIWDVNTFISIWMIIGLLYLAFHFRRRNKLISFGIFWFFISLSIESSVIAIKHVIFEHRVYLPFLGFALVISELLRINIHDKKKCIVIVCIMFVSLIYLTNQRNQVWQDELIFWQDSIRKSPQKARGYIFLAGAYEKKNDYKNAFIAYNQAIELRPQNVQYRNQRADYFYKQRMYNEALADAHWVLNKEPNNIKALLKSSNIFGRLGQYDKAIVGYNKLIDLRRDQIKYLLGEGSEQSQITQVYLSQIVEAYANRANAFELKGDFDKALEGYNNAIKLSSDFPSVYLSRGKLLSQMNLTDKSIEDFEKYIQLNPDDYQGYFNRGNQFFKLNRFEDALNDYMQVTQLNVNYSSVYNNIGTIYAAQKEFDLAIAAFSNSIKLDDQNAVAYYKRSFVYYAKGSYLEALKDVVNARKLGLSVNEKYVLNLTKRLKK